MIETLTAEQEAMIIQNRDQWLDKFFKFDPRTDFDEVRARRAIMELYSLAGLSEPEVVFVDSPIAIQAECNRRLGTNGELYNYSHYGNAGDFGWIAMYDTIQRLGVQFDEKTSNGLRVMTDIIESGCFMSVQLQSLCVVSKMPAAIHRDSEMRLHSTSGYAISFLDGTGLYYVCGRSVEPEIFQD